MSQVATLTRINRETLEAIKLSKQYPTSFEEQVYVDRHWEAIMYILGGGFIGKAPTVSLFMPDNIIIQYKDEYMMEGIRYHDKDEIEKMKKELDKFQGDQTMQTIDLGKMNQQVMHQTQSGDLKIIQSMIVAIQRMFNNALEDNSVIIGSIG